MGRICRRGPGTRAVAVTAALCAALGGCLIAWRGPVGDAATSRATGSPEARGDGRGAPLPEAAPLWTPSSPRRFLEDLDDAVGTSRDASDGASEPAQGSVGWTDDAPLEQAAASVLRAYGQLPSARLMASGYIDLKGMVWGAIVFCPEGWVDVVMVDADAGDGKASVRVARSGA